MRGHHRGQHEIVRLAGAEDREERHVARWLAAWWGLIALKCLLVWWACGAYPVPFGAWWVIAPTLAFGALCTMLFVSRHGD